MHPTIKNVLGVATAFSVLFFGYAAISYVRSYRQFIDPSLVRSFTVSGEGKVIAIPDVAQFTFGVVTEGGLKVNELQEQNAEKANGAIAHLTSLAIDEKDIATQQYAVEPRYQYYNWDRSANGGPVPPPEIVGYTVRQSVTVKVRNFDVIADALSGVVEKGANTVSQLSFTIDDITELQHQAREKAIAQAQEKAQRVASAAQFMIGRLLGIDEYGGPVIPYYTKSLEAFGGDDASVAVPSVEPGSQEVVANITLRYEIR